MTKNAVAKQWTLHEWADGTNRSYPEPSGPVAPSWLPAVGEWGTIPDSTFDEQTAFNSSDYPIFVAWGGSIVNTVGVYDGSTFIEGIFTVYWGGGHGDSSRNTVYAFGPLDGDEPRLIMLRDATSPAPTNVAEDANGNPVARHTYNTIFYDPVNNRMVAVGGLARATDANGVGVMHYFDFTVSDPANNSPWGTLSTTSWGGAADVTAYDADNEICWYHANGQNQVGYYDVANDTHTSSIFKSPPGGSNWMSALDTNRGIWAIFQPSGLSFYRTNNGTSNDYYTPTTTGTAPSGNKGAIYDPVDDRFVVWADSARTLYTLTAPETNPYSGGNAWTWSSFTPTADATPSGESGSGSGNGESGTGTGPFGKFAYIANEAFRGYVLMNRASDPLYFYRVA